MAVHEPEYDLLIRPIDSQTKGPVEPAHKFEVRLEPDYYTNEKSAHPHSLSGKKELILVAGTSFTHIIRGRKGLRSSQVEVSYANVISRQVHQEEDSQFSKDGFKRFLCSGLRRSNRIVGGKLQELGSYHQCYRLDGRLVAIGVLDLLPNCISSVYLM